MTADLEQADLEQVIAGLRAAGWRSSEERLQTTAVKRLATARHHQQQADILRATAETFADDAPMLYRHWIEQALRHEVRAAERGGVMTRAVRQVAFRLVPTWTGDGQQLLAAAEAVSQTPDGPPSKSGRSPSVRRPTDDDTVNGPDATASSSSSRAGPFPSQPGDADREDPDLRGPDPRDLGPGAATGSGVFDRSGRPIDLARYVKLHADPGYRVVARDQIGDGKSSPRGSASTMVPSPTAPNRSSSAPSPSKPTVSCGRGESCSPGPKPTPGAITTTFDVS